VTHLISAWYQPGALRFENGNTGVTTLRVCNKQQARSCITDACMSRLLTPSIRLR